MAREKVSEGSGEEFPAVVTLDALDGNGELGSYVLEETKQGGGGFGFGA